MRTWLLAYAIFCLPCFIFSQVLPANQLLTIPSLPPSKIDHYISQKGFSKTGTDHLLDTVIHTYYYRGKNKRDRPDSIVHRLERRVIGSESQILYETGSAGEFQELCRQLKKAGFSSTTIADTNLVLPSLYQYKEFTVLTGTRLLDDQTLYSILVEKRKLPALKEIQYAEDLLAFNSHVNLAHVFGAANVRKDIYYFNEKEFSRCSVLYPHTERQAVFIWQDEVNDCNLQYVILGGQLNLKSAEGYIQPIPENSWILKSRVRPGMNLRQLRVLNGTDFNFYNVGSAYSGKVIPGKEDKIDFNREGIVLACMNCNDLKDSQQQTLSADEAIAGGRSFFVFTILLLPSFAAK
ncbi:MAG TPA: hypothetical protein VFX58_01570 [Chitinophagaceae bacterium]|nr:hypothetical protein [Chitinophagaceae bacterium]